MAVLLLKVLADVEFALRLEPQTEELKKQRTEVKSLLEKVNFFLELEILLSFIIPEGII